MAVFPDIKSFYTLTKTPAFSTIIAKYGHRVEQRVAMDDLPVYSFTMLFPFLTMAEADTLMAFFIARKGAFESFYLQNQEEAYRGKKWTAATVYVAGDIIRPVTISGRSYKCTTGGTSHGSTQPTWPTTYHGTVSDNGIVWTENSYTVRFAQDMLEAAYVFQDLYDFGTIELLEVPS